MASRSRECAAMPHIAARLRTSAAARVGIMMLALSASAFAAPGATAQGARNDKGSATVTDKGRPPVTDKVIISDLPQRKSKLYALLAKVLGKTQGEKLGHTQSEVCSVPQ